MSQIVQLDFEGGFPNTSLDVGDMVFYVNNLNSNLNQSGYASGDTQESTDSDVQSEMVYIGNVVSINTSSTPTSFIIYVETLSEITAPLEGDYILFAKNNMSSSDLIGYYNKVLFKNDSPKPAELFGVSLNYTESSK